MIRFEKVRFSYGKKKVFSGLDLHIAAKDYIGIIGPNGSGKSIFLKLILGLLKPQGGKLHLESTLVSHPGYVPQSLHLDPRFPIPVEDIVASGGVSSRSLGWGFSRQEKEKTADLLQRLGLWERRRERYGTLSEGLKKRALIARALVSQPQLLLLDEPMAGLDPAVEKGIIEFLGGLKNHLTVLHVSHDLNFVSAHIQKVLCFSQGQVVEHATQELDPEFLQALYHPQSRIIQHSHPPTHE